jgi:hypothetical protein
VAVLVATAAVVGQPTSVSAAASTAPRVAVIVGPVGSLTAGYRHIADLAAAEALHYTPNVVKVYSPNATWSRVKAAIAGATIVVYFGQGNGFPSPHSATLLAAVQDGFGLNPVAGADNSTTRFYGEGYIRAVPLAQGAVVLLSHVPYTSGNGEPGWPEPTLEVARRRVDNYGAGFLAAGASAVIAEMSSSPVYYIRTIFTQSVTLDAMWRAAPIRHGHVTSFSSTRTSGATGRTDPITRTAGYDQSIVGRLTTTTATVRGIAVPASIDSTGATDASAALYAWVRTVPDGSTIVFQAGGNYRMDTGLIVNGRHNLTFEGNGATLKSNGGYTEASSLIRVFGDTGIVIRDFNLVGNSPTPGIYRPGQEGAHGIQIVEGGNIEIANVNISNTYGDCVNTDYWTDGVQFHDSTCTGASRCGFAIFSGKNILIEHDTFGHNGGMVLDIEPYEADGGADTVQFINNTSLYEGNSRDYSLPYGPEDYFFGANGGDGGISNITISGNTLVRGIFKGILSVPGTGLRYSNIVITNNTALGDTAVGPTITLAHIDGLTVTGNRVSLSSGQIARITDSTGVTYSP